MGRMAWRLNVTGKLYGLGLGPGDPELITMKAYRILTNAKVVAYPAPDNGPSFARRIAAPWLNDSQLEIPIIVPMRVERNPARDVYDKAAGTIASHLDAGSDVAVLCEGDPFFYGSFMYLFERLSPRYEVEIVPGVSSVMAGAAACGQPLAARNDIFTVIPAPLDDAVIKARIEASDAVAIIKIGRHYNRIRRLLEEMNLHGQAGYVERVTLEEQKLSALAAKSDAEAPYFSIILVYKGVEAWITKGMTKA